MKLNRNGIAIIVVVGVIVLLAGSVTVNVTGILPNQLGQGIQSFVAKLTGTQLQAGSVYGVPFITDVNQNTITSPVQPLSSVSASFNNGNPVTVYDSSKTTQGAVGDTFYTNINVQNGTDTAISVTLTVAIQKNGANLQTASLSGTGTSCTAPCQVTVNAGQIARGGGSVVADFAGQSSAASSTYSFVVTGGQVCVTFAEMSSGPVCHPLAAATVNTATLTFSPTSGATGAFTTTVTGTPSTQPPSGSVTTTTTGIQTSTTTGGIAQSNCQANGGYWTGKTCLYSAFTFYG